MAAGDYHPSSVNYTIQVLKIILNDAVAQELLDRNPAAKVKPLKHTGQAVTVEEQRRFLDAAKRSFYYEFFAFLLLTGMRHGEGAAMQWGDVDFAKNVLRVTKSLSFDENGHVIIGPPKSAAGIRDIPINDEIRKILILQARKIRDAIDAELIPQDHLLFFPQPHHETVLHNATANKALQRVLQDLEDRGEPIRPFSLHALRDTFATRFIEQGGSPQTLKTLLGHKSLSMTMDLYSQVLPNTKQEEMDRIRIGI